MPHAKPHKAKRPFQRSGKPRYEARGRFWIDGPEGTFMGHGRAVLLERISETGSITKAARTMGMSYRHAWQLVESMNRQAPEPFVLTSSGGRGGGGTVVTEAGLKAARLFWKMDAAMKALMAKSTKALPFEKRAKR